MGLKKKGLLFTIFTSLIATPALAGTVSFDQLAVSSDLTVAKYNSDLNKIYQDHNNNIQTSNILDDTIGEADMADEINPRIRTYEGASCEKVDDGLLNTTTSGTLSGAIPTGTAYPRGYRCDKTSTTAKTWTASKWTFLDIDQNCNFQFSEVAISAATPSVATNAIRISRVSTDSTQIVDVQDLRTTSCSQGSFTQITSATNEANLDDVLKYGKNRTSADQGYISGLRMSWDGLTTTVTVQPGAAYINGKYRIQQVNESLPQTADDPSNATSGLDTGTIAASTKYFVFAGADLASSKDMSFTLSTNPSTPSGMTNYRRIGQIKTDASSNFVSQDMLTYHTYNPFEIASGGVKFDGTTTPLQIGAQFNVSSLTDNGAGNYTITWDTDFNTPNYLVWGASGPTATDSSTFDVDSMTAAATSIGTVGLGNARVDMPIVTVIASGDKKE